MKGEHDMQSTTGLTGRAPFGEGLARWTGRIGGAMILLIALMVTCDIIARNVANAVIFNAFELSIYVFAVAIAFGMAAAQVECAHIRIDVVYGLFSRRVRRMLDLLALATTTAVASLFAWRAVVLALESLGRNLRSNTSLSVPLGIPQGAWALGLVVFAVVTLLLTVRHARLLLAGNHFEADRIGAIALEAEAEADAALPVHAAGEVRP